MDGPYGAPSSHIFRAQHAVLIGTGIGVTPFASILQSIMHRYWNARQDCPNCKFTWCSNIPKSIMNLRKVQLLTSKIDVIFFKIYTRHYFFYRWISFGSTVISVRSSGSLSCCLSWRWSKQSLGAPWSVSWTCTCISRLPSRRRT